jgi:hypothetical protein
VKTQEYKPFKEHVADEKVGEVINPPVKVEIVRAKEGAFYLFAYTVASILVRALIVWFGVSVAFPNWERTYWEIVPIVVAWRSLNGSAPMLRSFKVPYWNLTVRR